MPNLPPPLQPEESLTSPRIRELINAIRDAVIRGYVAGPGIDIVGDTISGWDSGGGGGGTYASPKTIGSSTEGSEAADTETWDITNQGSNDGAVAWITTAIVYNEAGDQILYEFRRPFTWDSDGRLVSIGAETRITTETPELGCT